MNRLAEAANSISRSLQQGHSEAAIRQHFLAYGWTNPLIDEALGQAKSLTPSFSSRLASLLPVVCIIGFIVTVAVLINTGFIANLLSSTATPGAKVSTHHVSSTIPKTPPKAPSATGAAAGSAAKSPTLGNSSLKPAAPSVTTSSLHQAPSCVKDNWSLAAPSYLNLDGLAPGSVHTLTDPIHYYTVYGYTGQQLVTQLNQCSPVVVSGSTFFAYTKYATNFTFSTKLNSQGECTVSSAVVGLHIAQVFPNWSPSPYDEAGLSSYWSSYLASLVSFEQGHINIVTEYANKLQLGLDNYAPGPCSNFATNVQAYANSVISAGITADQNYDYGQNHGPHFTFN